MRRQVGWLTLGVLLVAAGCAEVLGLEARETVAVEPDDGGGEPEPSGPVDKETGKETTEQCITYCDEVMKNCPVRSQFQQYISRATCISTCNALEPGDVGSSSGNNVECRLRQARAAANSQGEFCGAAGPGGNGECGTNCEAWCTLLESECPAQYSVLNDCLESCASIPSAGNVSFSTSYPSAPNLQCRLYHLGAVADGAEHCNHVGYRPTAFCVPDPEGVPSCDEVCSTLAANCREEDDSTDYRVYETNAECRRACEVFEKGFYKDLVENTAGCRLYHAGASATSPAIHCKHAGPTGDGHCGITEPGRTGNCQSYCLLFQAGCENEFAAEYTDLVDCEESCSEDWDDHGAANESGYQVSTARDSDTVQCHTYYAVKAVAGDETACERASFQNSCN